MLISKKYLVFCAFYFGHFSESLKDADSLWSKYVHIVYGESANASAVPPYSLDFIYKRADVEVKADITYIYPYSLKQSSWVQDMVILDYAFSLHHNFSFSPQPDNTWIEVIRQSTRYCHVGSRGWSEGVSGGMWAPTGRLPFGCWFWVARGSGVFIDLRRSLVVNKREFVRYIQNWCEQSEASNCNILDVSDVDKLFCTFAIQLNYDTVQLLGDMGDNEVLVCYDRCISEPVDGACPPIELRSGLNAEDHCDCSEEYPLLNCNRNTAPREQCRRHPAPLSGRPVVDVSQYAAERSVASNSSADGPQAGVEGGQNVRGPKSSRRRKRKRQDEQTSSTRKKKMRRSKGVTEQDL